MGGSDSSVARLKSITTARSEPSGAGTIMMFSGLRSRWMIPCSWATSQPGGHVANECGGDVEGQLSAARGTHAEEIALRRMASRCNRIQPASHRGG